MGFFAFSQNGSPRFKNGIGVRLDESIGLEYRRALNSKLELRVNGTYGRLTRDYRNKASIGFIKYFREEKMAPGFFNRFRPYFSADLEYEHFILQRFDVPNHKRLQANFSIGTDVRLSNRLNLFTELQLGSLKLKDSRYDLRYNRNFQYFGGAALGVRYRF